MLHLLFGRKKYSDYSPSNNCVLRFLLVGLLCRREAPYKSADMFSRYVRESDNWSRSGPKGVAPDGMILLEAGRRPMPRLARASRPHWVRWDCPGSSWSR
jgi:hypothetical protein